MDPFLTGQISMKISGPWTVSAINKFKPDLVYGVFPIPTPTGDNYSTWSGGWAVTSNLPASYSVYQNAYEFRRFLLC
jgi:multiple sugar transport system substrate-binding protein